MGNVDKMYEAQVKEMNAHTTVLMAEAAEKLSYTKRRNKESTIYLVIATGICTTTITIAFICLGSYLL